MDGAIQVYRRLSRIFPDRGHDANDDDSDDADDVIMLLTLQYCLVLCIYTQSLQRLTFA